MPIPTDFPFKGEICIQWFHQPAKWHTVHNTARTVLAVSFDAPESLRQMHLEQMLALSMDAYYSIGNKRDCLISTNRQNCNPNVHMHTLCSLQNELKP